LTILGKITNAVCAVREQQNQKRGRGKAMRYHTITVVRKGKAVEQRRPVFTMNRTWTRRGFTRQEAVALQEMSPAGRAAPYIQYMIARRIEFYDRAKRLNWSDLKIKREIAKDYREHGVEPVGFRNYATYFKRFFYDYLHEYRRRGEADHSRDNPYWRMNPDWQGSPHRPTMRISDLPPEEQARAKQKLGELEDVKQKITRAALAGDQKERSHWTSEMQRLERELGLSTR
jgi:hypothetical protein